MNINIEELERDTEAVVELYDTYRDARIVLGGSNIDTAASRLDLAEAIDAYTAKYDTVRYRNPFKRYTSRVFYDMMVLDEDLATYME